MLDTTKLRQASVLFTYENNALMEIGTIKNAIEMEDQKGQLFLLRGKTKHVKNLRKLSFY
ncbi:MAG: hypothetical protein ACXW0J_07445 [Nitrososphaeraceae archaeon]